MKALVLAVGLASVTPAIAEAQSPAGTCSSLLPQVPRGSRVRVRASVLVSPLIANVLSVGCDTLVLFEESSGPGIWSLSFDQLQRLEASMGSHNMHRPYIAWGAVIGAVPGAIGGLVFASAFSPSDSTKEYSRPLTLAVGSLVGAGVGAFIGSRRKAEQFARIPLPRRASVVPNGRSGLRFSLEY